MALFKRMEIKGLLQREADPGNRRSTRVRLTGKGREVYRKAAHPSVFDAVVGTLSEQDRHRLKDNIEILIASAEQIVNTI
jgi:DNA-binding MarR family transcriptional regulator